MLLIRQITLKVYSNLCSVLVFEAVNDILDINAHYIFVLSSHFEAIRKD